MSLFDDNSNIICVLSPCDKPESSKPKYAAELPFPDDTTLDRHWTQASQQVDSGPPWSCPHTIPITYKEGLHFYTPKKDFAPLSLWRAWDFFYAVTGQIFLWIPSRFSGYVMRHNRLLPFPSSSLWEQGSSEIAQAKVLFSWAGTGPWGQFPPASLGEYLGHLKSSGFATMLAELWIRELAPGAAWRVVTTSGLLAPLE